MNDLLEDRLSDLFERVGIAAVVEDRLERVDAMDALESVATGPRKRPWMLVAAAAVVLAGAAGVVRVVSDRAEDRSVVQQPAEPPGPLYVFPNDLPGWTSGNGSTSPGSGSAASYEGIVFGIPIGEMFNDPAVVVLTPDPPDGLSTDTWRQVSAGGQMVFTSPEVQGTQHTATQQLDTGWLTSSSDSSAPNVSALGSVEVDSAGTLTLSSPGLDRSYVGVDE